MSGTEEPPAGEISFEAGRRMAFSRALFMSRSQTRTDFGYRFGAPENEATTSGAPLLDGAPEETLFADARPIGIERGVRLFGSGDWLLGVARVARPLRLGEETRALYATLLEILRERGRHPARIWNFVPAINADGPEEMENYRAFCRGRAQAWDASGIGLPPAASAVGSRDGGLCVLFAAAGTPPLVRENPEQVPAYEYPPEHGPRSPSFSRASQATVNGRRHTFVSGTAAIKGHATVAPGDLAGQIACTLDNLRLISAACGLGPDLAAGAARERHFKIYLRHAADLDAARRALDGALLRAGDRVSWLHADICRAALDIEIEATVLE